jgi:hypothetical protein
LLQHWKAPQCCHNDCCGIHAITLTNSRLLSRSETCSMFGCLCGCCCKHPHVDSAIYLRNIAQIKENSRGGNPCCNLIIDLCNYRCCCPPKPLLLRGSFGSEHIYVDYNDSIAAQTLISVAIAQNQYQAPVQMMAAQNQYQPSAPMITKQHQSQRTKELPNYSSAF